jgi:hypothetical protein
MRIKLTTLLSLFFCISLNAQSFSIPTNPTLTYLYKTPNEIGTVGNTDKLLLFPITVGNKQANFKLIKNKNGLFALVDGTGQVYKATNLDKAYITLTRIDSTHFSGNTFESINFSYNNVIYNLGGYGFWNRNGQLSHFTNSAEWSIDKINFTNKTLNTYYSYQPLASKIYYIGFPWNEESTYDKIEQKIVTVFDISKKENKIIGKLNSKLDLTYKYFTIDIASLKGILNYNEREIYLYNFAENKVFKLTNNQIKESIIGKAGAELQTTFEDSGKIYYSFTNDTTLRSLTITMNDFKEEPYPLFITDDNKLFIRISISLIAVVSIVSFLFLYLKRKKNIIQETISQAEIYTSDLGSNEFNLIEITLISKLIEQSNIDNHLTVDELNSILGIKKKTIEIQKRVRTEAINRINHKFNVNFNIETIFIERTRSSEDRRYFNYIINKENVNIYLKKIR